MDINDLKITVADEIDARFQQFSELSGKIHAHPEVAFQEVKAAAWLAEYLEENGFSLERGICNLPTAFRAGYGKGEPVIAIMAEYDALPEIGHACGHNLIATSAVAAGVAAKKAVDAFGGKIMVMGTPGEELSGGKAIMAERGAFADLDVAMMVHPSTDDVAAIHTLACQSLDVEFLGKAAHAAARPEAGINALEAMLQAFNAINSLRQQMRKTDRINGIITDGGEAANVIPAHTAASFIARSESDSYLNELKEKVINCFAGAAAATGAKLEYKWAEVRYASMLNNMNLARIFRGNMKSLGHNMRLGDAVISSFSTDMGNVSQLVPAIHPLVAVGPLDVFLHSPQFAQVAISDGALRSILEATKAMAMTVLDILSDREALAGIKAEFLRGKEDR